MTERRSVERHSVERHSVERSAPSERGVEREDFTELSAERHFLLSDELSANILES